MERVSSASQNPVRYIQYGSKGVEITVIEHFGPQVFTNLACDSTRNAASVDGPSEWPQTRYIRSEEIADVYSISVNGDIHLVSLQPDKTCNYPGFFYPVAGKEGRKNLHVAPAVLA